MDGKHFYSTRSENANQKVLVGIRAHSVDILTDGGQVITTHKRVFGDNRSDVSDYTTTLAVLMKNSGAWGNSGLRQETPDVLRTYMDAQPKEKLKRAGFPTYKTFEGYSYQHVKLPPAFSREELESLEFVPGQKNLVLYGPVGVGKTHMAIAVGVKACNLGYKTKFYTVTELVLKLAESRKNGTLDRLLRDLRSLDLLILDEWGYVPVDKDGSQLLFRVISDSYESKSLILTTNLEFSKWGGIFTDDQMAAAMIDRLVHHGHLLIFEGKSYRMEHALMRQDA